TRHALLPEQPDEPRSSRERPAGSAAAADDDPDHAGVLRPHLAELPGRPEPVLLRDQHVDDRTASAGVSLARCERWAARFGREGEAGAGDAREEAGRRRTGAGREAAD